MSDFIGDYVLQTRREIDAEKHSRDNILNVVILALGAVGFAMFKADNTVTLVKQPLALVVQVTMLATVTGLFWLRRKKLQQIADRWFVLHNILECHLSELPLAETLEAIVEKDLQTTRYTRKDVWLCVAVSCPIYGLATLSLYEQLGRQRGITGAAVTLLILVHFAIVACLMIHPFKCPEPLATARQRRKPNQVPEDMARKVTGPQH
jgi:cytochrome bd-type quinol oxidase subunit 2